MAGLDGKTAIVTGASSGIGAATAHALAGAGARVIGGARRVERLETEVKLSLDVTDASSCETFVEQAGPVDILVNGAGLALADVDAMQPADVADCVLFALTRPRHVNVDELVVMALAQSSGARIHRPEA